MADPSDTTGEPIDMADLESGRLPSPADNGPAPAPHPLIWAALLVWLSVEAIGDGLLALVSVLASVTRTVTASTTSTAATDTTAEDTPTPTPS